MCTGLTQVLESPPGHEAFRGRARIQTEMCLFVWFESSTQVIDQGIGMNLNNERKKMNKIKFHPLVKF